MKIIIHHEDYIRVEPCYVLKKTKFDIVQDPRKGLAHNVLTYKVLDENKDKKFKDKIVGAYKADVFRFETLDGVYYLLNKKNVIFFTVLEDKEFTLDEDGLNQHINTKADIKSKIIT